MCVKCSRIYDLTGRIINDLVAVVTYYGLSWLLLLQVLHLGG